MNLPKFEWYMIPMSVLATLPFVALCVWLGAAFDLPWLFNAGAYISLIPTVFWGVPMVVIAAGYPLMWAFMGLQWLALWLARQIEELRHRRG